MTFPISKQIKYRQYVTNIIYIYKHIIIMTFDTLGIIIMLTVAAHNVRENLLLVRVLVDRVLE